MADQGVSKAETVFLEVCEEKHVYTDSERVREAGIAQALKEKELSMHLTGMSEIRSIDLGKPDPSHGN